jgi:hypothetical protein
LAAALDMTKRPALKGFHPRTPEQSLSKATDSPTRCDSAACDAASLQAHTEQLAQQQ